MANDYRVRAAEPGDRAPLKELMLAYIVDFYGSPRPADEKLDALMDELLQGRIGRQWVAEDTAGRLVGFVTLYYTYSTLRAQKAAIMNDLYVSADYRRAGVAADLFAAIRSFARADGCAYLGWETGADNVRAQRFYEKMGGERGTWLTYSIDL
ncbi:GNAT family N-acetyltransferase [Paenibacillus chartarius]|uniref:GNAT family N-acetyltransferase n=1 Tax=Paenibacillus chartarius TaxID=747481 RepID=A0ABV6DSB3_9BACL